MRIRVINGPNLNLLGQREPGVYGRQTYADLETMLETEAAAHGLEVEVLQSNHEGQLIDWIQEINAYDCLIINPAAYSHTSIGILDALLAVQKPSVEVHLSQIYQREAFRQQTITAQGVQGLISGLGIEGYRLALLALKNR